jgi:hypothetical protein
MAQTAFGVFVNHWLIEENRAKHKRFKMRQEKTCLKIIVNRKAILLLNEVYSRLQEGNFDGEEEEEETIDIFRYLAFDLMTNNESMGCCEKCHQGMIRFNCTIHFFLVAECDGCQWVRQIWDIIV